MALLSRNRAASFVWVRDTLNLTDGNLGSHVERLVASGYVHAGRQLTRTGFQVWLRITAKGDEAYRAYLSELQALLELGTQYRADSSPETAASGSPRPKGNSTRSPPGPSE